MDKVKNSYITFLQKLVQTPSANPFAKDLLKTSPYTPVELEVAELIYKKLEEIGLSPRFVGVSSLRPNVVAEFGDGKGTLVSNGHMDTVLPSSDYSFNPYSGFIKEEKLYGLGSYDMKASLAAFVAMSEILLKYEDLLGGRVQLQFVVDEETFASSPFGTKYLLEQGLGGDAAIVGEPGTKKICIGNRGGYRFFVEVYGESCHTGLREWEMGIKGRNTILEMQRVIQALQGFEKDLPQPKVALFAGRRNVFTFPTVIEGGSGINVVPPSCRAYGDLRILPGVKKGVIEERMRKRLEALGIEYKLRSIMYVPAVWVDENERIVQVSRECIKKVFGREPELGISGAWSDMWMFVVGGIPAINFGPDGGNAHAADEFVSLESFVNIIKVYCMVALKFFESNE